MIYFSIDIETTGLDPETCDILEVGMVMDDLSVIRHGMPTLNLLDNTIDTMPTFRAVVIQPTGQYTTTAFCADMHRDLWDEINRFENLDGFSGWEDDSQIFDGFGEVSLVSEGIVWCEANHTFYCTPATLGRAMLEWLASHGVEVRNGKAHVIAAGKNFGSFDRQFLENLEHQVQNEIRFSHRAIDPGSMWMRLGDSRVPDMNTCMKRAGISTPPEQQHKALVDAFDVVRLVRAKLGA